MRQSLTNIAFTGHIDPLRSGHKQTAANLILEIFRMYPLTRLALVSLKALRATPLEADGIAGTSFRCRPWDLDKFMEMNNGRVLTLYDLEHDRVRLNQSDT